ncbi:MAG: TVP38/TMEM64 family protein [bacterium]|nr:TVP38/TMEM64 family protein [bacterium]
MRRHAPVLLVGILLTGLILGQALRAYYGVDFSLQGIRDAVLSLGWKGPAIYFVLVVFRQFLGIPALLILTAGGLCFGPAMGTALGGGGIILSGFAKFGLARWLGREWVIEHLGEAFRRFEPHVQRLGPTVIGLSTAHPFGILSPFHWGAGLSSVRLWPFASALVIGAPVRAFACSAFGSALLDDDTTGMRILAVLLSLSLLLPLMLPGVRRKLFGAPDAGAS